MSIEVINYTLQHETLWDDWCRSAENATFLHTRQFLGYHRDRFQDASALLFEADRLVGVLPAARALQDPLQVVSHPGITFGGILHQGWLSGNRMLEAFEKLQQHYKTAGFNKLLYKALPHSYARVPAQDDLYALFRMNAARVRCDLSCTIDLHSRRTISERRRRSLKKALKVVTCSHDKTCLADLWQVLVHNLEQKHGAKPVHTLEELTLLMARFPDQIQVRCALLAGQVEAGVIFFNSATVWHAQYIASSETGYANSALDAVFEAAITEAKASEARYFDFGTSNEEGGLVLNDGLYRFKSEFGGGGVAHEYYELML